MSTKNRKNKRSSLRYLLFLPFLFFTFCEQEKEVITISPNNEQTITIDSKVTSLMMSAIGGSQTSTKSNTDDNDQCVEFEYPITFFVIFPNSQNIEAITINSDEELFDFFNTLTSTDEIRIDFPMVLLGTDGEDTVVNNLAELEEILQIAVDACSGSDTYEYCHENNRKVYICHNGNTICVSVNAIQAHLDHGDELGQCNN